MTVLLGRTSAGTTADFQAASWTAIWKFTAAASGDLKIIKGRTKVANAALTAVKLGIWADDPGNADAGALLGSASVDNLADAKGTGVFQATLASTVPIVAGTVYWLGWRGVGEQFDWQGDATGSYLEVSTDFPNPFSGGSAGSKNAIIWGEDAPAAASGLRAYKDVLTAPAPGTAVPFDQTISPAGLDFVPKVAIFFCTCDATPGTTNTGVLHCAGAAVGPSSMFNVANASDGADLAAANCGRFGRTTECIVMPLNGTPALDALAKLTSFNSSPFGFTLTWTDVSATTGMVVNYLLLGGDELTNAAFVEVTPSSTTNGATQAINFGFQPDCVLTFSPAVPGTVVDANLCIGAATRLPSTVQYASFWYENDAAANMDCALYSAQNRMLALPGTTAVKDADASLTSWDASGITITWNDAPGALTGRVYMLALKGGQYDLDFISSPTATGNQSIATPFQPSAMIFFGSSDPTDTDNTADIATADSEFVLGAADGSLRQGSSVFIQQDANAVSKAQRRYTASKAVTWLTGITGTLQAEASVSAVSGSGYTLNWNAASATVRKFAGLAMGSTPGAPPPPSGLATRKTLMGVGI